MLVPLSAEEAFQEYEKRELEKVLMMVQEGREFSLPESLAFIGRGIIHRALRQAGGNRTRAARLLGLSDRSIRRHLQRLSSL
jgi:DNA-binding NtrC family response regulator